MQCMELCQNVMMNMSRVYLGLGTAVLLSPTLRKKKFYAEKGCPTYFTIDGLFLMYLNKSVLHRLLFSFCFLVGGLSVSCFNLFSFQQIVAIIVVLYRRVIEAIHMNNDYFSVAANSHNLNEAE